MFALWNDFVLNHEVARSFGHSKVVTFFRSKVHKVWRQEGVTSLELGTSGENVLWWWVGKPAQISQSISQPSINQSTTVAYWQSLSQAISRSPNQWVIYYTDNQSVNQSASQSTHTHTHTHTHYWYIYHRHTCTCTCATCMVVHAGTWKCEYKKAMHNAHQRCFCEDLGEMFCVIGVHVRCKVFCF